MVQCWKGVGTANLDAINFKGFPRQRPTGKKIDAASNNRTLMTMTYEMLCQLQVARPTGMLVIDEVLVDDQQMHELPITLKLREITDPTRYGYCWESIDRVNY